MSSRLPLALALPLLLAGCGTDKAPPAATAPRAATVAIVSFKYKPATVHVRAGGKVAWLNRDSAGHTATFTKGPSKLDTDRLAKGDRASLTFPSAGRYAYVCAFHAFMKGEVVVDK
jgi:plastocyanin